MFADRVIRLTLDMFGSGEFNNFIAAAAFLWVLIVIIVILCVPDACCLS